MLLGTTLLLTLQWHFPVLQAAASIAPGPLTAGIVLPFSGRLSARFGTRSTVVAGAVLFAAAGAWPLASAGDGPAYAAVVLPSMLLWGMANALRVIVNIAQDYGPTHSIALYPSEVDVRCSRDDAQQESGNRRPDAHYVRE